MPMNKLNIKIGLVKFWKALRETVMEICNGIEIEMETNDE